MKPGRIFVRVFFLAAVVIMIAALAGASARRTVSADAKAVGGIRYGYQLESYRFRDRMFLRFWNSAGSTLDFDLPGYYPSQLNEARWLAGDGAIYLRATVVHRDAAGEQGAPVKLLYNFRSGELFVSAPFALWRLPAGPPGAAWLTDEQFETALTRAAETEKR